MKRPLKIKGCKPVGSLILVEVLEVKDFLAESKLIVETTNKIVEKEKQAYVVATGPKLDDTYGIKVGDRVLFTTGNMLVIPDYDKNGRKHAIIDPTAIRAIIEE